MVTGGGCERERKVVREGREIIGRWKRSERGERGSDRLEEVEMKAATWRGEEDDGNRRGKMRERTGKRRKDRKT